MPSALSPAAAPSRTSTRIAQLRQRIVAAAWRLFAEHGFDGTTMTDIATAADVPRRSLFRYFPTKEDIVFTAIDQNEGAFIREMLAKSSSDSPPDRLIAAYRALSAREQANAETVRAQVRLMLECPSLTQRLQHELLRWQHEFIDIIAATPAPPAADLARQAQVAAIATAYFLAVCRWIEDESIPLSDWFEHALRGLTDFGEHRREE